MYRHSDEVTPPSTDASWFVHDPEQGMLVELHSLSKADLNGRYGECAEWVPGKERWAVLLHPDGEEAPAQSIAVKPANLRRAAPAPMDAANLANSAAEKAIEILSNMRVEAGDGGYNQADIQRVHALFDEAERHDWALVKVHQGRADLALMRGDLPGSLRHFRRAVANGYNLKGSDGSQPGEQQLLRRMALASALGNSGDLDGESEQLRKVLVANPGHLHARLSLGQSLAQRGKGDDAVPELLMALQLPNEGPGRMMDDAVVSQLRRAALKELTGIYGNRALRLSRQHQHRASVEQLQKLAKILYESLAGPQYVSKGDQPLAGHMVDPEAKETITAETFGAGGRRISHMDMLCQIVLDLARTESNMTADYLELNERGNAEAALERAAAALALHPTTQADTFMQGRLKYEHGKVKEHEGDEVAREGGEGTEERAAALYREAKELYRASHKLAPDGAAQEAFSRAQIKAHPDMEFLPTPGTSFSGGGVGRLKPGRPAVQLEQLR
jgi:hypothetical protein